MRIVAEPKGEATGAVVVVQEIFGVTDHIKRVADQFAAEGLRVDRARHVRPRRARRHARRMRRSRRAASTCSKLEWPNTLADVAGRRRARARRRQRRRGRLLLGRHRCARCGQRPYAWTPAVSYYGGGVARRRSYKKPRRPMMYHFGDQDRVDFLARTSRKSKVGKTRRRSGPRLRWCRTMCLIATSAQVTARRTPLDGVLKRSLDFLHEHT